MKSFLLNTWSGKILIIVILLISFWFLISKNIFDVEDELIKKYPTLEKKFDGLRYLDCSWYEDYINGVSEPDFPHLLHDCSIDHK